MICTMPPPMWISRRLEGFKSAPAFFTSSIFLSRSLEDSARSGKSIVSINLSPVSSPRIPHIVSIHWFLDASAAGVFAHLSRNKPNFGAFLPAVRVVAAMLEMRRAFGS